MFVFRIHQTCIFRRYGEELPDSEAVQLYFVSIFWAAMLNETYYLRSIAATSTEKSTVQQGKLNAVSSDAGQSSAKELGAPAPVPTACSLDDPDCEACQ